MLCKNLVGFQAMVSWEQGHDGPDSEEFAAAAHELYSLEAIRERYMRFISACEQNENQRHSRTKPLAVSPRDSVPIASGG